MIPIYKHFTVLVMFYKTGWGFWVDIVTQFFFFKIMGKRLPVSIFRQNISLSGMDYSH
jgi:hypothetical protein